MRDEYDFPEDREPLDTHSMLMEGFMKNLNELKGGASPESLGRSASSAASGSYLTPSASTENRDYSTEKVLTQLFDVYDELVGLFGVVNRDSVVAQNVSGNINKVGQCIRTMGGEINVFSPLDHISGLQAPDLTKNAKQVVENTKQCYTLGSISEEIIENNGQAISLVFSGKEKNIYYKAKGQIIAHRGWSGSEALDYVYTPQSGKLSVKAFEGNRWADKSDNFEIYWELDEYENDPSLENVEKKTVATKEVELENKKDNSVNVQGGETAEGGSNNFPISEG